MSQRHDGRNGIQPDRHLGTIPARGGGQALHDHDGAFDGLVWRSRQFNDSLALMLWGDRVSRFEDLQFDPDESPVPLFAGPGLEIVQGLANDFGITVID